MVLRHADRARGALERVFGDHGVLRLAQQETDRRRVVRALDLTVHRSEVEPELAQVLRLELDGL